MVTNAAEDAALVFPAASVATAVIVCAPATSVVVVIDQAPAPSAFTDPIAVTPSNRVTVLFASAVPVKVGVVTLVMLSELLPPLSEPAERSGMLGGAATVSIVTILGALLMGVTRRAAAEFSFFLAVPTLAGAAVYDLYKNWDSLSSDGMELIAIGFVTAFLGSLWVIKWFVGFVSRRGFEPFAWYRIVAGTVLLAAILL